MINKAKSVLRRVYRKLNPSQQQELPETPIITEPEVTYPYVKSFNIQGFKFDFHIASIVGKDYYDYTDEVMNGLAEPVGIMKTITAGDRVLELGTHHGFYTTFIASIVGEKGNVLGLEAFPHNSMVANANLGINKLGQAKVLNIAGAETDGTVSFASDSNGSVVLEGETWNTGGVLNIPALSVDTLVKKYGPFDAIKIDVEGLEQLVLQGATKFLSTLPKICIEIHAGNALRMHNGDVQKIFDLMHLEKYQGYVMYKENMQQLEEFDLNTVKTEDDFNLFLTPKG